MIWFGFFLEIWKKNNIKTSAQLNYETKTENSNLGHFFQKICKTVHFGFLTNQKLHQNRVTMLQVTLRNA